jgi:nucleoside 2-deoxyribosyltransferase
LHLGLSTTKKLYVCGSFKFLREIEELERKLQRESIEHAISKREDSRGIQGCLEKINRADVVYVVNPGGYVGRSVSVDIGYAYARGKPVYAMHAIDDPPVMNILSGVLSQKELVELLKEQRSGSQPPGLSSRALRRQLSK